MLAATPASTAATSALASVLRALRHIGVDFTTAALTGYSGEHSSGKEAAPLAIAFPRTIADIARLVQWARQHDIGLTTFSSPAGHRQHGATATTPTLFVDMSTMSKVLFIDNADAVAVIEPGVTFAALDAALAPHGLRSFKPLLPRPDKSVLAACLEREPILQAKEHWDVLDPLGAAEMVFGTGELFRTGSAASSSSMADQWKAGVRFLTPHGPIVTDFMRIVQGAQGTMGIVGWAAVFCERLPQREEAYFIAAPDIGPLLSLSARLHRRRLGSASFIVNAWQLATMLVNEPAQIQLLASTLPTWILLVSLTANAELPDEQLAYELSDLRTETATCGLTLDTGLAGHSANSILHAQSKLPQANYKNRYAGAHQSIFFLSQLDRVEPFIGAAQALATSTDIFDGRVGVYLQPRLHGRNVHLEFVLPHAPDATPTARSRSTQLATTCCALGGFFSRPYGSWAPMAYARNLTLQPYLQQSKALFDPDGVLNPGRLCF